jgi:adenylosuccinate lyase
VIPDSCILLDYMLSLLTDVIDRLIVYPENMLKNLHKTNGLVFSESVLLALTNKGMKREDAYRIVQTSAMDVWQSGKDFGSVLKSNEELTKVLMPEEIDSLFDLDKSVHNVEYIFERVGLA